MGRISARASIYAVGIMDGAGWITWVAIALGSATGGVLRQWATEAVTRIAGGFPGARSPSTWWAPSRSARPVCVALSTAGGTGTWGPVARHATMTGLLGWLHHLVVVQRSDDGAAAAGPRACGGSECSGLSGLRRAGMRSGILRRIRRDPLKAGESQSSAQRTAIHRRLSYGRAGVKSVSLR